MARFKVTCPHCQALLELDAEQEVVVSSSVPEQPRSTTSFEDRLSALSRQREEAQAKLAEAMRAEKAGAGIREERFKKLLEEAKDAPPEKPIRDIDLD